MSPSLNIRDEPTCNILNDEVFGVYKNGISITRSGYNSGAVKISGRCIGEIKAENLRYAVFLEGANNDVIAARMVGGELFFETKGKWDRLK